MSDLNAAIRFDGKVVLVTGAGRGLGRAHATLLASRGATVIVADYGGGVTGGAGGGDPSAAHAVVGEIRAQGWIAEALTLNLATEEGAEGAIAFSIERFGRIDAVVHNAGIVSTATRNVAFSSDDFHEMIAINTNTAFWLARAAWPAMRKQGSGRFVATTSAAIFGEALYLPYSMAKASLIGFVRTLAVEGRDLNILFNAVSPWGFSRMAEAAFPDGKFKQFFKEKFPVEQVSPLVAYLCSDECVVSGEIFSVGGNLISRTILAETVGTKGINGGVEEIVAGIGEVMAQKKLIFPRSTVEIGQMMMSNHGFADDVTLS